MKNRILSSILVCLVFGFALFLSGCTETPNYYDLTVQINGANFGRVYGGGKDYAEGTSVTIKATEYTADTFLCWVHNNKVVSTKKEYTFDISKHSSGTYIALFKCPELEFVYTSEIRFANTILSENPNEFNEVFIKKITISMGYLQDQTTTIFEYEDDIENNQENIFDSSTLYSEDPLPFVFDKTKKMYVKILVILSKNDSDYISETIKAIDPVSIGQENLPALSSTKLNTGVNPSNNAISLQGLNECTTELTFANLSNYQLPSEEE